MPVVSGRSTRSPPRLSTSPAPLSIAPTLPDDAVARIVDHVDKPADLLRLMATSQQWRRVALRHDVLARHLHRLRPGAAAGLAPSHLREELVQQASLARHIAGGEVKPLAWRLPRGLTLLQLSRNVDDGPFLVAQLPLGGVGYWPLNLLRGGFASIGQHPGPMSSLAISADGRHIASASSAPSFRPGVSPEGAVMLWSRATPSRLVSLCTGLSAHVSALAVAPEGQAVAAYLPGRRAIWLWRLGCAGLPSAAITLACDQAAAPNAYRLRGLAFAPEGLSLLVLGPVQDGVDASGGSSLCFAPAPDGLTWRRAALPPAAAAGLEAGSRAGHAGAREARLRRTPLPPKAAPLAAPPPRTGALVAWPGRAAIVSPQQQIPSPAGWRLGQRDDWQGCVLSPCGKLLLSRTLRGEACLWLLSPGPAVDRPSSSNGTA